MEEAAAVRRAASEATADVVPEALRETIDDYVADDSVVPGVLTLLSARVVTGEDPDGLTEQAAGVQLIYDGLRLTRHIVQSNPWAEAGVAAERSREEADMAILAADVLVSRGFYLLARTEAAEDAVAVVRAFGRDQTECEDATGDRATSLDRRLETDILELAVTTGVTAAGGRTDDAAGLAAEFAPDGPRFDAVNAFFDDARRDRIAALSVDGGRALNRND
ncbi:hypothetical protein BRD07_06155 [Halobacteriales archaeon QS_9_68_42]|nr:MAG: hypothetical protein BRC84_03920 [Halobacteriales archaeon QS_1_68_44]PSQ41020.1 MAG: hypothetical protein BRD07_06155 [Halobacteriales archaeon QS_9_68_42]